MIEKIKQLLFLLLVWTLITLVFWFLAGLIPDSDSQYNDEPCIVDFMQPDNC